MGAECLGWWLAQDTKVHRRWRAVCSAGGRLGCQQLGVAEFGDIEHEVVLCCPTLPKEGPCQKILSRGENAPRNTGGPHLPFCFHHFDSVLWAILDLGVKPSWHT